jgi:serine/threonine protein kinase/WD40 repeat protein
MSERSIFLAALDFTDPSQRSDYLDQACGGNGELRRHIDELIQAEAKLGGFLIRPHLALDMTVDSNPITERPGSVIGPYKLLQQIGEGGMGVVYLAEQSQPVKRRVALKIIKPGMDTKQVIARFEAERQALTLMDHPNIARVLDAGTTDSGRPYFVMELVKGQPITQYCDERQLTPSERLELFLPVCQAIQHAHQKGIIHRDVKPSNILVAEYDHEAVPKVIDFGVAKATSQTLTEKTMFTGLGQIIGTLEYMSPEQAKVNQLDIDTRSDIYSLGVLLYELLTGSTPFDKHRLRSAAFDEMLRIIREEEPPLPSTRLSKFDTLASIAANRKTDPLRLSGIVRGELDWIVMKALDKDRNRRYETATSLAADLKRYLSDEQVQACPPTISYRLSKLIRRNRIVVTTGSIVAAALLCGVIVSGWFAVHENRQRVLADKAQEQADNERKVAEQALSAAEIERNRAELSEQTTSVALDKATALNTELTKTKEHQRRMLYGAQMNLVQKAWDMDDVPQVQKLLNATRQRPGETDLRGIEWHYWQRMLHQEERVLQLPLRLAPGSILNSFWLPPGTNLADGAGANTTFSHDGKRLAVIAAHVEDSRLVEVLKVWNTESDSVEPIFSWNLPSTNGVYKKPTNGGSGLRLTDMTVYKTEVSKEYARVGYEIVFLDSEQVVISTGTSESLEDPRFRNDLERARSASSPEKEGLNKELALLTLRNFFEIELQTIQLNAAPGVQPVGAHPPIKVLRGFAVNRDRSLIATPGFISKEGESQPQSIIRILDGRTGEQIDQFPSPFPNSEVLALSPDATRLVVTESLLPLPSYLLSLGTGKSPARRIEILDVATRNSVAVSIQSGSTVRSPTDRLSCAFSPDGTRFAVDQLRKLSILEAATGRELFSIEETSPGNLQSPLKILRSGDFVAFSPDGKWLASTTVSIDQATNVLKVWEAATGKLGTEFKGKTSLPIQAAFSADSKQLYAADQSGAVKVWRLPTKTASEPVRLFNENTVRTSAPRNGDVLPRERITAYSSDRRWTASAPMSVGAYYRDANGRQLGASQPTPAEPPYEIELEDTSGLVPPQMLSLAAPASQLIFSPDGNFLVSKSVDESAKLNDAAELKVWSVASGKLLILPPLSGRATEESKTVAAFHSVKYRISGMFTFFSPDSRRLVSVFSPSDTGGEQLAIRMWDLAAGRELPVAMAEPLLGFLNSKKFSQRSLTFSSDSKLFLIANPISSKVVPTTGFQILDAVTGALRWAEDSPVASPVFSSDAARLAGIRISTDVGGGLTSSDIVVWDTATGKEVGVIPLPPNHNVRAWAVSHNGKHVAATSPGSVTLYDVATATALHVLDGSYSNVWFSPDGQRVIAAYNLPDVVPGPGREPRRESKVWDVVTGQELMSRKLLPRQLLATADLNRSLEADQKTATGLWSLSPQAEAEGLVDWLSASDGDGRFLTRSQICEQIKTDPFASAQARTVALKMASNVRRSAEALSTQALKILNSPTQSRDEYKQALDWISEAVEQDKENSSYASYQGIAYYRLGQYADSLTALARSKELHAAQKLSQPAEDLTVLAMAQYQAGQSDEARATLEQARTSASRNKLAGQKLLAEAETLLGVPHANDNP